MLAVGDHIIAWKGGALHGMESRLLSWNCMRFMNRMEYLANGKFRQTIAALK
jgi:hypothetical protein